MADKTSEFLSRLKNYESRQVSSYTSDRPSLSRYIEFLDSLGAPQNSLNTIIVAGSKGKGTTAATLEAMFLAAGRNVGLYTSPHIFSINERIRIAGRQVSDEHLSDTIRLVEDAYLRTGFEPSWFEAITTAAYILFHKNQCDPVILEVGLGGRLDATNATEPKVALITSLSLEHTDVLGNTMSDIAYEKAQVIKSGTAAITVPQCDEAMRELLRRTEQVCAQLHKIEGSHIECAMGANCVFSIAGQCIEFVRCFESDVLHLDCALAASGYVAFVGSSIPSSFPRFFDLRGRYEWGRAAARVILLDGAHTPESISSLLDFAAARFDSFEMYFSCMTDKRIFEICRIIRSHEDKLRRVFAVELNDSRAASPNYIADAICSEKTSICVKTIRVEDIPVELRQGEIPLVVTGSFRLLKQFVEHSDYIRLDA